eukprot:1531526-Rhodomonas_salina.1
MLCERAQPAPRQLRPAPLQAPPPPLLHPLMTQPRLAQARGEIKAIRQRPSTSTKRARNIWSQAFDFALACTSSL